MNFTKNNVKYICVDAKEPYKRDYILFCMMALLHDVKYICVDETWYDHERTMPVHTSV